MENLLLWVVSALLLVVSGKWIICIFLLPSQWFYGKLKRNNCSNKYLKLLSLPFIIVTKMTRGGYELWMSYCIGLIPSCHIRKWYCQIMGAKIAPNVIIHIGTQMRAEYNLIIGEGSIIGDHVTLDARGKLKIGRDVNISSNVSIWTYQHDYRSPDFACPTPSERRLNVDIGDRVWLGCNVIVLPGVTIGEGAVCCGGCVVTKNIPPYTVVAGIPAHKVGERPQVLTYHFTGKSCHIY